MRLLQVGHGMQAAGELVDTEGRPQKLIMLSMGNTHRQYTNTQIYAYTHKHANR